MREYPGMREQGSSLLLEASDLPKLSVLHREGLNRLNREFSIWKLTDVVSSLITLIESEICGENNDALNAMEMSDDP
jgi:hypothetical protein